MMSAEAMPGKRSRETEAKGTQAVVGLRAMPAAEALSFLRDTRGLTTWNVRNLATSLKISAADAGHVIAILQLQGYVKPSGQDEWMTTLAGEEVSGSKPPRFTRESVEHALAGLRIRIAEVNHDSRAPYRITQAVAFGDFLSDRARVQSADVGIQLQRKGSGSADAGSAEEHTSQAAFLKSLKGKSGTLQLRPCESWMAERTHRNLL